ncbi:hypothetical protein ACFYV7_39445 [Nocardia suismassiliense]|uniref:Uncharacterized protein n=1 Tax=Nocardia suismassiliense TaxID=2077092 RepID=A0ABW6R5W7_9NOCA
MGSVGLQFLDIPVHLPGNIQACGDPRHEATFATQRCTPLGRAPSTITREVVGNHRIGLLLVQED